MFSWQMDLFLFSSIKRIKDNLHSDRTGNSKHLWFCRRTKLTVLTFVSSKMSGLSGHPTLIYSINDVVLARLPEQERSSTLENLERNTHSRGW